MSKTILVLGGYGGTGKVLCRRLLEETDVAIIVAGRNIIEADRLCLQLRETFPGRTISCRFADASDYSSLLTAFQDVTLVVDATTATSFIQNVAKAAIEMKTDLLDCHFEQKVVSELSTLKENIQKSGRCFITQAGFHPGLPSAIIRYVAPHFDTYSKAIIGMAMNETIDRPESVYELIDTVEHYFQTKIYKKRAWKQVGFEDHYDIDFGSGFGVRTCYPLQMEELFQMPELFDLEETGVYVAGFNWFIDYLVFPLAFFLFSIQKGLGRELIAKLLVFGFRFSSSNKKGVSFVLEADGIKNGTSRHVRVLAEHENGYEFTAIPIIACIQQYLDGTIAKPGLWLMGQIVDPDRLFEKMKKLGVQIQTTIT